MYEWIVLWISPLCAWVKCIWVIYPDPNQYIPLKINWQFCCFFFFWILTRIESWHERFPTDYKSNDKVELLVCEISTYPKKELIIIKLINIYIVILPKVLVLSTSHRSESIANIFKNSNSIFLSEINILQNSSCNQLCTTSYSKSSTNS